jgi:hypothetical protein
VTVDSIYLQVNSTGLSYASHIVNFLNKYLIDIIWGISLIGKTLTLQVKFSGSIPDFSMDKSP